MRICSEMILTTWSQKRNEFFRLRTKIEITKQTLTHLKKCKKYNKVPSFIRVTTSVKNKSSLKAKKEAEKRWLNSEISRHHSNLNYWEKLLYELHLRITKECSTAPMYEKWLDDDRKIREIIEHKKTMTRIRQQQKFKKLIPSKPRTIQNDKCEPVLLDDFVINLSTKTFSDGEMALLNRGLKFILPPKNPPVEDVAVDVMSSLRREIEVIKDTIEREAVSIVKEKMINERNKRKSKGLNDMYEAVESLREKNVVFTKADKSNNIIILERDDYERIVKKTISQGQYVMCENDPLHNMVDEVNSVLDKHKDVLCNNPRYELRKWKVSNPEVPCLYVLLKTHKEVDDDGDMKSRPVASNTNAPTEAIAKKLTKIFNGLPKPKGLSVLNGTEFAKQVNGVPINRNEEMGSYDVSSLYPSVPIDFSMRLLMKWLIETGVRINLAIAYADLSALCMKQNFFQFRGRFYFQTDGASIGNALSCFIAELFMCHFETKLERHPLFPRYYRRYIDDIFAIQNKRKFDIVKKLFEDEMDKIKDGAIRFTIERQVDGKLPFLNVMCDIVDGKIEIDVYRKPCKTMRLITNDSFHDMKHKMAAYHSMAHYMMSIPLSDHKIEKETNKILEIGRVNGFKESAILDIIDKHKEKKQRSEMSTLYDDPDDPPKRISFRYYPKVTKSLKHVYKRFDIELVHRNEGSLRSLLGTTKDTPLDLHKSGIYRIQCGCCGRLYFGMTVRKLFVRFNEHIKSAKWKQKTAVGQHIFSAKHKIDIGNLKLIQPVRQLWKVEYYEAIHIHKHKHENLLNVDNGNIKSALLDLFVLKRRVDENIIDLIEDTPNSSASDIFYDCV